MKSIETDVKRVCLIEYVEDYGGVRAWAIQESYNGKIDDPNSHKILKREYFKDLQDVIQIYLEKGYEIKIWKRQSN